MAITVSLLCTIALPIILSVFAIIKKQTLPLFLGILAFTLSQFFLRIPLLQLLSQNSTQFSLFQMTSPIIFLAVIALSAGLFEETARWIAIKYFMKKKPAHSAIYFGFGHGGIEAVLIVGVPLMLQLLTLLQVASELNLYFGAIERVIAIVVHISLSIIVFYSVKQRKLIYLLLAIVLHGIINFTIVIVAKYSGTIIAELVFMAIAILLLVLSMYLLRRMNKHEKEIINDMH